MTQPVYIGIDISKRTLDIATTDRYLGQVPNTPAGHAQLLEQLAEFGNVHLAMEASGGYERPLLQHLLTAGSHVSVVQPACVRHFAKSLKLRAKTDRIDAMLIARFAATTQPRPAEKTVKPAKSCVRCEIDAIRSSTIACVNRTVWNVAATSPSPG